MARVLKKAMLGDELLHPSKFVSAVELRGRDVTVTIKSVSKEDIPKEGSSKKDTCAVLEFAETPKKMVLNKVNSHTIITLYGAQAKGWLGKRITLYPDTCRFGADIVDCIRVRDEAPAPKAAPKPQASTGDTDIDAAMNAAQENKQ